MWAFRRASSANRAFQPSGESVEWSWLNRASASAFTETVVAGAVAVVCGRFWPAQLLICCVMTVLSFGSFNWSRKIVIVWGNAAGADEGPTSVEAVGVLATAVIAKNIRN